MRSYETMDVESFNNRERPTKRKKTKAQTATARADKYFSLLVRARAAGHCRNCDSTDDAQCAHGFSRRYRNVRWEFGNAWCLCKGCHLKFTMRPLEWDDWMRRNMGAVNYRDMRARALSTEKLVDVKTRAVELEQMWKDSQC